MIKLICERIISWLKSIFKKGRDMSFEFPTFKVEAIEEAIKLKETATSDGKNNLPRSNSRTFSNCENEGITKTDEFRNNQVKRAAEYLKPIKEKIIDASAILDQKPYYFEKFENSIRRTINDATGKISNLFSSLKIENNHVRTFKLENRLTREPRSLSLMNIIIGLVVIAILFLIELRVNTNLLAPAMISGKKEGMAIAGAVAGLNVLVSFFIGYIGLKHFHHINLNKRIIAKVGLFFYVIFIIYINWSMGAYRAFYEATGVNLTDVLTGEAVAEAVSGNPTYPWTITLTFTSLILVFVGIGFALLSLVDGYFFDDRYPGYGSVGKERKEKKEEINRIRQHISTEVLSKLKEELIKTREKQEKLLKDTIRTWSTNCTEIENVFEKYRRFGDHIDEGLDHIVGEYRSVNSMFRTTTEPEYWKDDQGKVKTRYYNLKEEKKQPEKVFLDFKSLYLSRDEIDKKIKLYQDQINNLANQYIGQINEYQEKINKEIIDIRDKYNPDNDENA